MAGIFLEMPSWVAAKARAASDNRQIMCIRAIFHDVKACHLSISLLPIRSCTAQAAALKNVNADSLLEVHLHEKQHKTMHRESVTIPVNPQQNSYIAPI